KLVGDLGETEVRQFAASAEKRSEHPLAGAIAGSDAKDPSSFRAHVGDGVEAVVDGHQVFVGTARLLSSQGIAVPNLEVDGTLAWVAVDGKAQAALSIKDPLKPHAKEAVTKLRSMGLEVWMVTGDREATARSIAREAGIENLRAE